MTCTSNLLPLLLAIIDTLLFIAIFCFARKFFLIASKLIENTDHIRRETETLFQQLQAMHALERKLNLPDSLPPMRGWAGSPDFLLKVAEEALLRKPKTVVECSSGVSTVVLARCVQINRTGHVFSLENDPKYAAKTRSLLEQQGLSEWATILNAPLITNKTTTPWYDDSVIQGIKIDMLVVDGPPATTAPLARYPALPRLVSRMASNCIVMLDDADRGDEIETLRRWKLEFGEFEQSHLGCEKGLVQLSRKAADA